MGEEVSYGRAFGWRMPTAMLLAVVLLGAGLSFPPPSWSAELVAGKAASASILEIRSIDLREGAPETYVDVTASGPVVWSSFRDADGNLIVELPDSAPAKGITGILPADGLVASVDLESDVRASRPMTRLKIKTREPVEHALAAEGQHLEVSLTPVEEKRSASFTYEPLPQREPLEVAALDPHPAPAPAPQEPAMEAGDRQAGTPDEPVVAPPPAGVAATRLEGVEVVSTAGGTVIRVAGDGEFQYSYFSLSEPDRFVIDLSGVINDTRRGVVQVNSEVVHRVRIAQFKPYPDPVSRVVFDLNRESLPRIEPTSDGLLVRFNGGAAGAPAAAQRAPRPVTPEPPVAEPEPEMTDFVEPSPTGEMAEAAPSKPPEIPPIETGAAEIMPEPRMEPRVEPPPPTNELELAAPPRQARPPIERELPTPAAAAGNGDFEVQTVGGGETRYVGEPIDMTVRDADVVEVLRMFAQISGLNVVIQPGVRGTVTVELVDVPWDQALEQILKINGLGFELEGNIMRVAPTSLLRQEAEERQALEEAKRLSIPLRTIIRRLSYANAAQVAALLRARGGVLSRRGSVIVDARTNTMILKELPDFMDTVIAVIENLDTPEPQVMIEARIIETSKRFTRTLGIQWDLGLTASPELGTSTGLNFPNNIDANAGVNLLTGGDNALVGLTLGNVLNSFTLDATLQAAESEGLINILSAPKVATLNNEQAQIMSGLQIPIQTVANNTVTVQFVNATLELTVTPQVTAEGTILMDIEIAKREPQIAFAVAGAANAPIATKEARTRVIVRDGGTTVIGGIYEVSTDQGEDRVPGLANIPIIGSLFRNKRRTDENEELLIFITPRVINL